jgi:hypothetical protein
MPRFIKMKELPQTMARVIKMIQERVFAFTLAKVHYLEAETAKNLWFRKEAQSAPRLLQVLEEGKDLWFRKDALVYFLCAAQFFAFFLAGNLALRSWRLLCAHEAFAVSASYFLQIIKN